VPLPCKGKGRPEDRAEPLQALVLQGGVMAKEKEDLKIMLNRYKHWFSKVASQE